MDKCGYRINLLPPELQCEREIDLYRLFRIAGTVLLAAVIFGGCLMLKISYVRMQNELLTTRQELSSLAPVAAQAEKVRQEGKELEAILDEYQAIHDHRRAWSGMLSDLNRLVPVDLWLTGIETGLLKEEPGSKRPDIIKLRGLSGNVSSVGIFVNNLSQLSYFRQVQLTRVTSGNEEFNFEITVFLKDVF